MLTTSAEDENLFKTIKSEAFGYLLKSTRGGAFIEALRGLEDGTQPFSPGLAARLLREFTRESDRETARQEPLEQLTERQIEVLRQVARIRNP